MRATYNLSEAVGCHASIPSTCIARTRTPLVADVQAAGHPSLGATADELNARGMLTRRGGHWHVSTVMNLLDRLRLREAEWASPG